MSEQDYLIAKASRDDWKNISHWEDKRSQGRSTARNGKNLAGAGGTAVVAGGVLTQYDPNRFGTTAGAFDDLNRLAVARRKNRATVDRVRGGHMPFGYRVTRSKFFPGGSERKLWDEATSSTEALRANARADNLLRQARSKELKSLVKIARRHPGPSVQAAGVGAMGVGGAMWAAGRAKARHAEAKIAQRRKERGKKG